MYKNKVIHLRISEEEFSYLYIQSRRLNYSHLSKYIRSLISFQKRQTSIPIDDFRLKRLVTRCFRCEEQIWEQIKKNSEYPSEFIRQAILEKLQNLTK